MSITFDRAYVKARIQQLNELLGHTEKDDPERLVILKADSDDALLEKISTALATEMERPDTLLLSDEAPVELLEFAEQLGLLTDGAEEAEEDEEESEEENEEENEAPSDVDGYDEPEAAPNKAAALSSKKGKTKPEPEPEVEVEDEGGAEPKVEAGEPLQRGPIEKGLHSMLDAVRDVTAAVPSDGYTVVGTIDPDMPLLAKARVMEMAFAAVLESVAKTDCPVRLAIQTLDWNAEIKVQTAEPEEAETPGEPEAKPEPPHQRSPKAKGKSAEEVATTEIKTRLRQGGDLQNKPAQLAYIKKHGVKTKGDPEKLTKAMLQQLIIKHYVKAKLSA